MTTQQYINLGRLITLISFVLGTGIFGFYFLTSSSELLFVGYGFMVLTGLVNICVLILILVKATKSEDSKAKLNWTAGIMLLNIPVMLFYCWVAIMLLNTMRITFTNSTESILTDINIYGCETEYIDKLDVGQSKTVWVSITSDCTIDITYLTGGQRTGENVAGYVTNNMGQIIKYSIGGKNDGLF
jgi:hypothetical protein